MHYNQISNLLMKEKQVAKVYQVPRDELFPTSLKIQYTYTEELVFALCGPIGSPIHKVGNILKQILESRFSYICHIIKLTEFIEQHAGKAKDSSKFDRVQDLINKGDTLRKDYGNSILADFAIAQISGNREKVKKDSGDTQYKAMRECHIIDSIKNQQELEALKSVYRDMLYFIGVFSPLLIRQQNLEEEGMNLAQVYQLIDRDSGEEIDHGQTVRETFPLADFFLRVDSGSDQPIKTKLNRFLNIIFGIEICTPSSGETAMYFAESAAGNSACLSRQVGAALTDKNGEIISVGWNDVPKAKGNLYQYSPIDDPINEADKRCTYINGGKCFNDSMKSQISEDIVKDLIEANLIEKNKLSEAVLAIQNSKIKDLIEFSRSIHAEMHAIIIGSQIAGNRIREGKLYCTTYPCHSCAGTL